MNWKQLLTSLLPVVASAGVAAAPIIVGAIPQPYGAVAVGVIGLITNIYHLYQPTPTAVAAFGASAK